MLLGVALISSKRLLRLHTCSVGSQSVTHKKRSSAYNYFKNFYDWEQRSQTYVSIIKQALQNGVHCFPDWCLSLLWSALNIDLPFTKKQNEPIFFSVLIFSLHLHSGESPTYSFWNLCCQLIQLLLKIIIGVKVLMIVLFENSISKYKAGFMAVNTRKWDHLFQLMSYFAKKYFHLIETCSCAC